MNSLWHNKEEFRRIPGDNRFVSASGLILSQRKGKKKMLSLVQDAYGYLKVSRPEVKVHRAVLLAWRGPCPSGFEARHLDGNPSNNHVSNLAWGTSAENGLDKRRHGSAKGERNPASKMYPAMVERLRKEYKDKPLTILCKENPSYSKFAIWAAVSGYTWSHLPGAQPRGRKCYKGNDK